jgi:hypothetical protein
MRSVIHGQACLLGIPSGDKTKGYNNRVRPVLFRAPRPSLREKRERINHSQDARPVILLRISVVASTRHRLCSCLKALSYTVSGMKSLRNGWSLGQPAVSASNEASNIVAGSHESDRHKPEYKSLVLCIDERSTFAQLRLAMTAQRPRKVSCTEC